MKLERMASGAVTSMRAQKEKKLSFSTSPASSRPQIRYIDLNIT